MAFNVFSKRQIRQVKSSLDKTAAKFAKQRQNFEHAHQTIYTFFAGVGLIMFWYGIWEGLKSVPVLGEPPVAIAVGAVILLTCGAYAYQFVGNKAEVLGEELDDVTEGLGDVAEGLDDVADNLRGKRKVNCKCK